MMNPFRTALVLALLGGSVMACARPTLNILNGLGPVMDGECSEKALFYGDYSERSHFFHAEDDYVEAAGESNIVLRLPDNVKTPEQAQKRFEKNKAAFEDLLGWRISFEDFCRKSSDRRRFAVADIQAKILLVEELWAKKFSIVPEIAREQFDMGVRLLEDVYSEYEGEGMAERRYGGMTALYRGESSVRFEYNLAGEMAYFLYFRQRMLEQFAENGIWLKLHEGLIRFYADDPESLLKNYGRIPLSVRAQWFRRQNISLSSPKASLDEVRSFLRRGPLPARITPAIPESGNAIKNLEEYWVACSRAPLRERDLSFFEEKHLINNNETTENRHESDT